MGTLMAQFTYIGYEAPAQFAEETKRADRVVPWGIVLSVVGTAVLGFSYLLTLLFCIQARALFLLLARPCCMYSHRRSCAWLHLHGP